jgi:hypothetical protein
MKKIILIFISILLLNIFSVKAQLDNADALIASTFIGGNDVNKIYAMAIDNNGDIIVVGHTESTDFPTTIGVISTNPIDLVDGWGDIFISKFNSDLTELLASTYLGGTKSDYANAIVIDDDNNIYITGHTKSTDFPTTTGAYDETANGDYDSFVAKVNSDLTSIIAATYFGGNNAEQAGDIKIMSDGKIIITGYANGSNVPTTENAYNMTFNGGYSDSFISVFSNDLDILHASTYIGGSNSDSLESIEIDDDGDIIVVGYTVSQDFPTTSGVIQEVKIHDTDYEGFICSFSSDLETLQASTFLGTENAEQLTSVIIDDSNNIIVLGRTDSDIFPTTTGVYDETYNGDDDVFITKINNNLTSIVASTYFGGADYFEYPEKIDIDNDGNIVITGRTGSADFPTTPNAYDNSFNSGYSDAFVSKFNSDLTEVLLSTFIGGEGIDIAEALCIDNNGNMIISGDTESHEFPITTGAFNTVYSYNSCFVTKLKGNPTVSSYTNIDNNVELKIYPNPSNGIFKIENKLNKNMQITVLSISGSVLLNVNATSSETLNLTDFNSGIYFIKTKTNNIDYYNKIIIQ